MTEIDLKNFEKIDSLVTDYFDLETKSLKIFRKRMYQPEMDDTYKKIFVNSPDLRIRYKISDTELCSLDRGWNLFKEYFYPFFSDNNVSYEDFRSNKITRKGKTLKLKKAITDFYLTDGANYIHDYFHIRNFSRDNASHIDILEQNIINNLNEIGALKLPSKGVELVLSMNFADWFLSASAEKWTSCINLESNFSGSFWSGLPGLVNDFNRAMIYITDGSRKSYEGIRTDSFITRSWVLLDAIENLHPVRFFPSEMLDNESIVKATKLNFKSDHRYITKHPIDFLYFTNKKSCFIYLDCAKFVKKVNGFYIEGTEKGAGRFVYINEKNENFIEGQIYNYKNGLSSLINSKKSLGYIYSHTCNSCGIMSENSHTLKDKNFCEKCYKSNVAICYDCGKEMWKDDVEVRRVDGKFLCLECHNIKYAECSNCSTIHLKKKMINLVETNKWVCENCISEIEEEYIACEFCKAAYIDPPENFFTEVKEREFYCDKCLKKLNDKHQLFINFSEPFFVYPGDIVVMDTIYAA